jgi:hypothetical protein
MTIPIKTEIHFDIDNKVININKYVKIKKKKENKLKNNSLNNTCENKIENTLENKIEMFEDFQLVSSETVLSENVSFLWRKNIYKDGKFVELFLGKYYNEYYKNKSNKTNKVNPFINNEDLIIGIFKNMYNSDVTPSDVKIVLNKLITNYYSEMNIEIYNYIYQVLNVVIQHIKKIKSEHNYNILNKLYYNTYDTFLFY